VGPDAKERGPGGSNDLKSWLEAVKPRRYGAALSGVALFGTDAKGGVVATASCGPAVVGQVTGTDA